MSDSGNELTQSLGFDASEALTGTVKGSAITPTSTIQTVRQVFTTDPAGNPITPANMPGFGFTT
jgi:hypothetical protein